MKTIFKYLMLILFAFTIGVQAQEEDGASGKRVKSKSRSTKKAKVESQPDYFWVKTDLRAGWDSNVYRTPSGTYRDPETLVDANHSPTSSPFLNPDVQIGTTPVDNGTLELDLSLEVDGELYLGGGNTSNANGMKTELKGEGQYHAIQSKTGFLHKLDLGLEVYGAKEDYNYLHRGTGALRNTQVAGLDEENRYKYVETGRYLKLRMDFSSHTRWKLAVGQYSRDYDDVATLGSYDRDVLHLKTKIEQKLGDTWTLFADWDSQQLDYKSHRANSATGGLVTGTLRVYKDQETGFGLEFDDGSWEAKARYEISERRDTYADYWSYEQNKISVKMGYMTKSKDHYEVQLLKSDRDYEKETNPAGEIRTREISSVDASWDHKYRWGHPSAGISYDLQADKDKYYAYERIMAYVGVEKNF